MRALFAASVAFFSAAASAASAPSGPIADDFVTAVGRIAAGGLNGEWRETGDVVTGRFATQADFGAYRTADIYNGRMRWRVDPSGGSHPLDSTSARQAAISEAWLARFLWRGQDLRGVVPSRPGWEMAEGRRYRVLTVTPRGGEPVRLWFDPTTGMLARATRWFWFFDLGTTYSDYREVNGRRLPFAIVNSAAGMVERIEITQYTFAAKMPQGSFARPVEPGDATVPAGGTTVPAMIFPQLTLSASVNGHPMDFLFDTGGHSILTPDAARALGLQAIGSQQTGGSGAGTVSQQDTRVAELRIGDAVLRDQHFYVLSLPYSDVEQGAKPPLGGLLGLEVAERFIVRIDYRAGTLSLLPQTSAPTCHSGWHPVRFTYDMPAITASLDGRMASFTVDTGNNGGLLLYPYWLQAQRLEQQYDRGIKTLSYGAGGASNNWISYADSFRIGGNVIARPMVRTTDDKGGVALSRSEAGNLGTSLLANYTITLDYKRSRGCFDYVPGYTPLPFNRGGLRAIKETPGFFLVTLVNAGGPAAQAGFRKDDRIIAVDGVPASRLGEGDLTLALTRSPGTRVQMRYERAGQVEDTVLITQELLK